MKKIITILIVYLAMTGHIAAQGVAIAGIDSTHNTFTAFLLQKSSTTVTVNNQIATTTTTQVFQNNTADTTGFKYAFPMSEGAAATRIRWNYRGQWETASLIARPQDSAFQANSGGTTVFTPAKLDTFLGKTPLYFPVKILMAPGEVISIELTYVELLPYLNNHVSLTYPSRYNLIQPTVDSVEYDVSISSYRSIDNLTPLTYSGWNSSLSGTSVSTTLTLNNTQLADHFQLDYLLHPDSIGFFGFSTYYPDSVEMCDTTKGFFTFIVEPNSISVGDIIGKDFVLIVDHSGSMDGIKMTQADEAAEFIVNNLNAGDRFNIVQFDDDAEAMAPQFLDYTLANKNSALNYISGIQANASTNISGAFDLAVPMYASSGSGRAKIIIFFTDGVPTAGITDETQLISHVTGLINSTAHDIQLHVFGIGDDVNTGLLTQMATQNNGSSAFLANNAVATSISNFYTTIQNPVLLNTSITYDPPVVSETYPDPLPNLYKGEQLIVSGRYSQPGPVTLTVSGTAFGNPVVYHYNMNLVDSFAEGNNFLPKIWAKDKIDNLMTQYYLSSNDQIHADKIKKTISSFSVCQGVISPFTSFSGATYTGGFLGIKEISKNKTVELLTVFPNPASTVSYITIPADYRGGGKAHIILTSLEGKRITELQAEIDSDGKIELNVEQLRLEKGIYLVTVEIGNKQFRAKLSVI